MLRASETEERFVFQKVNVSKDKTELLETLDFDQSFKRYGIKAKVDNDGTLRLTGQSFLKALPIIHDAKVVLENFTCYEVSIQAPLLELHGSNSIDTFNIYDATCSNLGMLKDKSLTSHKSKLSNKGSLRFVQVLAEHLDNEGTVDISKVQLKDNAECRLSEGSKGKITSLSLGRHNLLQTFNDTSLNITELLGDTTSQWLNFGNINTKLQGGLAQVTNSGSLELTTDTFDISNLINEKTFNLQGLLKVEEGLSSDSLNIQQLKVGREFKLTSGKAQIRELKGVGKLLNYAHLRSNRITLKELSNLGTIESEEANLSFEDLAVLQNAGLIQASHLSLERSNLEHSGKITASTFNFKDASFNTVARSLIATDSLTLSTNNLKNEGLLTFKSTSSIHSPKLKFNLQAKQGKFLLAQDTLFTEEPLLDCQDLELLEGTLQSPAHLQLKTDLLRLGQNAIFNLQDADITTNTLELGGILKGAKLNLTTKNFKTQGKALITAPTLAITSDNLPLKSTAIKAEDLTIKGKTLDLDAQSQLVASKALLNLTTLTNQGQTLVDDLTLNGDMHNDGVFKATANCRINGKLHLTAANKSCLKNLTLKDPLTNRGFTELITPQPLTITNEGELLIDDQKQTLASITTLSLTTAASFFTAQEIQETLQKFRSFVKGYQSEENPCIAFLKRQHNYRNAKRILMLLFYGMPDDHWYEVFNYANLCNQERISTLDINRIRRDLPSPSQGLAAGFLERHTTDEESTAIYHAMDFVRHHLLQNNSQAQDWLNYLFASQWHNGHGSLSNHYKIIFDYLSPKVEPVQKRNNFFTTAEITSTLKDYKNFTNYYPQGNKAVAYLKQQLTNCPNKDLLTKQILMLHMYGEPSEHWYELNQTVLNQESVYDVMSKLPQPSQGSATGFAARGATDEEAEVMLNSLQQARQHIANGDQQLWQEWLDFLFMSQWKDGNGSLAEHFKLVWNSVFAPFSKADIHTTLKDYTNFRSSLQENKAIAYLKSQTSDLRYYLNRNNQDAVLLRAYRILMLHFYGEPGEHWLESLNSLATSNPNSTPYLVERVTPNASLGLAAGFSGQSATASQQQAMLDALALARKAFKQVESSNSFKGTAWRQWLAALFKNQWQYGHALGEHFFSVWNSVFTLERDAPLLRTKFFNLHPAIVKAYNNTPILKVTPHSLNIKNVPLAKVQFANLTRPVNLLNAKDGVVILEHAALSCNQLLNQGVLHFRDEARIEDYLGLQEVGQIEAQKQLQISTYNEPYKASALQGMRSQSRCTLSLFKAYHEFFDELLLMGNWELESLGDLKLASVKAHSLKLKARNLLLADKTKVYTEGSLTIDVKDKFSNPSGQVFAKNKVELNASQILNGGYEEVKNREPFERLSLGANIESEGAIKVRALEFCNCYADVKASTLDFKALHTYNSSFLNKCGFLRANNITIRGFNKISFTRDEDIVDLSRPTPRCGRHNMATGRGRSDPGNIAHFSGCGCGGWLYQYRKEVSPAAILQVVNEKGSLEIGNFYEFEVIASLIASLGNLQINGNLIRSLDTHQDLTLNQGKTISLKSRNGMQARLAAGKNITIGNVGHLNLANTYKNPIPLFAMLTRDAVKSMFGEEHGREIDSDMINLRQLLEKNFPNSLTYTNNQLDILSPNPQAAPLSQPLVFLGNDELSKALSVGLSNFTSSMTWQATKFALEHIAFEISNHLEFLRPEFLDLLYQQTLTEAERLKAEEEHAVLPLKVIRKESLQRSLTTLLVHQIQTQHNIHSDQVFTANRLTADPILVVSQKDKADGSEKNISSIKDTVFANIDTVKLSGTVKAENFKAFNINNLSLETLADRRERAEGATAICEDILRIQASIEAVNSIEMHINESLKTIGAQLRAGKDLSVFTAFGIFDEAFAKMTQTTTQSGSSKKDFTTSKTTVIEQYVSEYKAGGKLSLEALEHIRLAATIVDANSAELRAPNLLLDEVHDSLSQEVTSRRSSSSLFGKSVTHQSGQQHASSKGTNFNIKDYLSFYSKQCTFVNPSIAKSANGTTVESEEVTFKAGTNFSSSYANTTSKNTYWQRSKQFWDKHKTYIEPKIEDTLKIISPKVVIDCINEQNPEFLKQLDLHGSEVIKQLVYDQQISFSDSQSSPSATLALLTSAVVGALTYNPALALSTKLGATGVASQMLATAISGSLARTAVALEQNGGDLGKALGALGKKDNFKTLLTDVASIYLVHELSTALKISMSLSNSPTLWEHFKVNSFKSTVGAVLDTTIKGERLETAITTAVKGTVAKSIGASLCNKIGEAYSKDGIDYLLHKGLHGVTGALEGLVVAGKQGMLSGALGAMAAEVALDSMVSKAEIAAKAEEIFDQEFASGNFDEKVYSQKVQDAFKPQREVAKLIGVTTAATLKQNAPIALLTAHTAVENNFVHVIGMVAVRVALPRVLAWVAANPDKIATAATLLKGLYETTEKAKEKIDQKDNGGEGGGLEPDNEDKEKFSKETQRLLGKTDRLKGELYERPGQPKENSTLRAAQKELKGEQIDLAKERDLKYDHVQKVRQAQGGLIKYIENIKNRLGFEKLSHLEKETLQQELSKSSKLLDYSESFVPRK